MVTSVLPRLTRGCGEYFPVCRIVVDSDTLRLFCSELMPLLCLLDVCESNDMGLFDSFPFSLALGMSGSSSDLWLLSSVIC